MFTKLTLGTLVVLLITVVAVSYYLNKEGFEDLTNVSAITKATNTINPIVNQPNVPPVPVTSETTSSTPERNDVVPEVKISGTGYEAMNLQQKMDLLRDIQQVVRNEVLAGRNTKPIISGETRKMPDTDCTAQGKEYEKNCHKDNEYRCPTNPDGSCPPVPDLTQYIKKDAIPCWGCSLDY